MTKEIDDFRLKVLQHEREKTLAGVPESMETTILNVDVFNTLRDGDLERAKQLFDEQLRIEEKEKKFRNVHIKATMNDTSVNCTVGFLDEINEFREYVMSHYDARMKAEPYESFGEWTIDTTANPMVIDFAWNFRDGKSHSYKRSVLTKGIMDTLKLAHETGDRKFLNKAKKMHKKQKKLERKQDKKMKKVVQITELMVALNEK